MRERRWSASSIFFVVDSILNNNEQNRRFPPRVQACVPLGLILIMIRNELWAQEHARMVEELRGEGSESVEGDSKLTARKWFQQHH